MEDGWPMQCDQTRTIGRRAAEVLVADDTASVIVQAVDGIRRGSRQLTVRLIPGSLRRRDRPPLARIVGGVAQLLGPDVSADDARYAGPMECDRPCCDPRHASVQGGSLCEQPRVHSAPGSLGKFCVTKAGQRHCFEYRTSLSTRCVCETRPGDAAGNVPVCASFPLTLDAQSNRSPSAACTQNFLQLPF